MIIASEFLECHRHPIPEIKASSSIAQSTDTSICETTAQLLQHEFVNSVRLGDDFHTLPTLISPSMHTLATVAIASGFWRPTMIKRLHKLERSASARLQVGPPGAAAPPHGWCQSATKTLKLQIVV
jgi:hypothetical protein